jgi:hypothetical protein
MTRITLLIAVLAMAALTMANAQSGNPNPGSGASYDVIIRHGHIIDGSGNPWVSGDIGIRGDRIAAIGQLANAHAKREIDATGMVVAPGFIDMLGQSEIALLIDNRGISKLSQGITSEITGEGGSIAPQNALTIPQLQRARQVPPQSRLGELQRLFCQAQDNRNAAQHRHLRGCGAGAAKPCSAMPIACLRPTN